MPVMLVDATVPVPLEPINSAVIQQNRTDIGCALLPSPNEARGHGFQIVFQWRPASSSPTVITGYNVYAKHQAASTPTVNTLVSGSSYIYTSCNAFVADGNLTGWQWRVQPVYSGSVLGAWSPWADFQFAPCLLTGGAACYAPPPGPGLQ